MFVSTLSVDLRFEAVRTLRQKRRLVRGILMKLRRHFNVSAVELGFRDCPTETRLGIAAGARTRAEAHDVLRHVASVLEVHPLATVIRRSVEDLR